MRVPKIFSAPLSVQIAECINAVEFLQKKRIGTVDSAAFIHYDDDGGLRYNSAGAVMIVTLSLYNPDSLSKLNSLTDVGSVDNFSQDYGIPLWGLEKFVTKISLLERMRIKTLLEAELITQVFYDEVTGSIIEPAFMEYSDNPGRWLINMHKLRGYAHKVGV